MKTWLGTLAVIVVSLLIPQSARATTGGPETVEVLGWDQSDSKVFVSIHYEDESGQAPTILYLKVDGRTHLNPVAIPCTQVNSEEYTTDCWAQLNRIRLRLQPLRATPTGSIPYSRVVAKDFVVAGFDTCPRYRVEVRGLRNVWEGRLQVDAHWDPTVRVLASYPIPYRTDRLAILSFVGIPYEGGYETQVPVILAEQSGPDSLIQWRRRK